MKKAVRPERESGALSEIGLHHARVGFRMDLLLYCRAEVSSPGRSFARDTRNASRGAAAGRAQNSRGPAHPANEIDEPIDEDDPAEIALHLALFTRSKQFQ